MAEDREKINQLVKAKTSSLQKRVSNIISRGLSDLALLDVNGPFLDYKSVIPKEFKRICMVDTKTFIYALKRMMILASDVRLDIKKNTIKLSTFNADIGEASEEIKVELDGEDIMDIMIVCNANLLIDILTSVDSEKIILKMNEHNSAVVIQHDGTDSFINAVVGWAAPTKKE